VSFGSALTNFGVQLFLDNFIQYAPQPKPQETTKGTMEPTDERFSGFVFKIQANMDPRHRDRVAYFRVVSGKFERDMDAWHPRLGRKVRLNRPMRLFGQDRETVDEAYAGDVVGLMSTGTFTIGDTISSEDVGLFPPMPRLQPEHFARLRHARADKYKQFLKGITQIEEEGGIQLFYPVSSGSREPIMAAVGVLQFDVVTSRREAEYNVETIMEPLTFTAARRASGDDAGGRRRWPAGDPVLDGVGPAVRRGECEGRDVLGAGGDLAEIAYWTQLTSRPLSREPARFVSARTRPCHMALCVVVNRPAIRQKEIPVLATATSHQALPHWNLDQYFPGVTSPEFANGFAELKRKVSEFSSIVDEITGGASDPVAAHDRAMAALIDALEDA